MPLPELTPEQRSAALAKAAAARRARADLKARLHAGTVTLPELFALGAAEEAIGKLKVSELLEALPGVGKVRATRLMTDCDISPNRRVRGLGVKQRAALQGAVGRLGGEGADRADAATQSPQR